MSFAIHQEFESNGVDGPESVFPCQECREILRDLEDAPPPQDRSKGYGLISRTLYMAGAHPAILSRVQELLGDDVMLGGTPRAAGAERAAPLAYRH